MYLSNPSHGAAPKAAKEILFSERSVMSGIARHTVLMFFKRGWF